MARHFITADDRYRIEALVRAGEKPEQIAPVYFCNPYHSWERGTNEFSNRMIRRFLPKGKSMDKLTHKQAEYITHWLNNYPRKLLGWQRPKDCMTG